MTYAAVVFDVLGTVVDEGAGRKRSATTLFASANLDAEDTPLFAEAWEAVESEMVDGVARGRRAWATHDEIRAEALHAVTSRHSDIVFPADALARAALFGRDLEPFAESVQAIDSLSASCPVFALTNGSRPTMAEMSRRAGLAWTELISADEVGTFKPNPQMYERLTARVGLKPHTTLFVAAHPWDLDEANRHGYETALVLRPGVTAQAGYDHEVQDLDGVARLFPATPAEVP